MVLIFDVLIISQQPPREKPSGGNKNCPAMGVFAAGMGHSLNLVLGEIPAS